MNIGEKLHMSNLNGNAHEYNIIRSSAIAKVNLLEGTSSCRKFGLTKISCAHAMTTLRLKFEDEYDINIYKFNFSIYLVEHYISAYSDTIYVVHAESK